MQYKYTLVHTHTRYNSKKIIYFFYWVLGALNFYQSYLSLHSTLSTITVATIIIIVTIT